MFSLGLNVNVFLIFIAFIIEFNKSLKYQICKGSMLLSVTEFIMTWPGDQKIACSVKTVLF